MSQNYETRIILGQIVNFKLKEGRQRICLVDIVNGVDSQPIKDIRLVENLGYQIEPTINSYCLFIASYVNGNYTQSNSFAIPIGDMNKTKILIGNINILDNIIQSIKSNIDVIDSNIVSNTKNASAHRAVAGAIPPIASMLNGVASSLEAENEKLNAEKEKQMLLKSQIDNILIKSQ